MEVPKGLVLSIMIKRPSYHSSVVESKSNRVGGVLAGGMGVLDDISGGNVSFGTVLNAANVLKNGGALTSTGIGGELLGSAVDAIGQTTGIDVSGVAGVAFPKRWWRWCKHLISAGGFGRWSKYIK